MTTTRKIAATLVVAGGLAAAVAGFVGTASADGTSGGGKQPTAGPTARGEQPTPGPTVLAQPTPGPTALAQPTPAPTA